MSEQIIKDAFISGYEQGHNDTVESCYGWQEEKADDYIIENKLNTRPPLPDDIQRMIDAAKVCETERHGCYGNNIECIYNRFDNGMGCRNNEHVTRLIEYITTGR